MPTPNKLVIDANILVALFLGGVTSRTLFFSIDAELCAPAFLFVELEQLHDVFVCTGRISADDFHHMRITIRNWIRIVPESEYVYQVEKAKACCPDKKDVPYFTLALHLNCPLWSNDKKLKKQKVVKVYSTDELLALLKRN